MTTNSTQFASIDTRIDKIPRGRFRVRLIGTIVAVNTVYFIINDGTHQIHVNQGRISSNHIAIGTSGRAIVDVINDGNIIMGTLVAWNKMSHSQIKKYASLIKIERRIPK